MNHLKAACAAIALLTATGASSARADCLADIFSDFSTSNEKPVTVVSLRQDNRYASYAAGTMAPSIFGTPNGGGRIWSGTVSQLFSDRLAAPSCPGGQLCPATQPFDVNHADQYKISFADNGAITIHNITWGFVFTPSYQCIDNGAMTFPLAGETWVVSTGAAFTPAPPPR